MAEPLLEIKDLCKSFGAVKANNNLSLEVKRGEIHALIGPNGAGKTTLINQIAGDLSPDSGSIFLAGKEVTCLPVHRRAHHGLARSYQITSVFPNLSVTENLLLAIQAHHGHSFRFWRRGHDVPQLQAELRPALEKVGLFERAGVLADKLSHGEKKQLEVGMALACKPQLLLLDEPMAGMGPGGTVELSKLIRNLKQQMTILLVEHDMEAIFALADRITVLVYGEVVATGTTEEIRNNLTVRQAYLGEEDTVMLSVDRIDTCYGSSQALFGVSLEVHDGEVVTLLGRNGMGKSTTIKSIMGLVRVSQGCITFNGVEIQSLPSYQVARLGIGLVPEGRQIFPNLTVLENIMLGAAHRGGRDEPYTLDEVLDIFPRLGERLKNYGNQLSGGEQQMLAVVRALMTTPKLLILDEATEGLAPLVRKEIWHGLGVLKARGQSILVIDKNLGALMKLADRHYIMEKGEVVWTGSTDEIAANENLKARYLGV